MKTQIKPKAFKHKGFNFKLVIHNEWQSIRGVWSVSAIYNPGTKEDLPHWMCSFRVKSTPIYEFGIGDTFEEAFLSAAGSYSQGIGFQVSQSKRSILREQRHLEKLVKYKTFLRGLT